MKNIFAERERSDPGSPVLKMNNPVIRPFYGDINDKDPYLIYGKYDQILKIEENHIRMVQLECIRNGKDYYNKAGTKLKPVIDQKKLKQHNVMHNEIQRLSDKYVIEQVDAPSANDPDRKVYVINNKQLAQELGYKGDKIRSVDYSKLYTKKTQGIANMCMVTVDQVKEVVCK